VIIIDFETRSRVDIKTCGVSKYVACPDFGVLIAAVKFDNQPAVAIYRGNPHNWAINQELIRRVKAKELLVAHNVGFDYRVYQRWASRMGWPDTPITQWACTQTAAMAAGLPAKLEHIGQTFGLGGKDTSGARLITELCKPDKETGQFNDTWRKMPQFVEYALRDVELTYQVFIRLGPVINTLQSYGELAARQADYLINDRGVGLDLKAVDAAITLYEGMESILNDTMVATTGGAVKKTSHNPGILAYVRRWYPGAYSVDKVACETLLALSTTPPELRKVIKLRQAASNTSIKKYQSMKSMALNGRARDTLRLYGAFTGRWAGRGIQTQNLPRGNFKDHDNATLAHSLHTTGRLPKGIPWGRGLSAAIRGCIIPAVGNQLIASDYNAIECRVLAWLAGEDWLLELFNNGGDPYKPMAAKILGKPVEQITKAERANPGKNTVLGCGYQMGASRFAKENNVDEAFAKLCVNTYRTINPMTKRLWYGVQDAAVKAISNPGQAFSYRSLTYCVEGEWLTCLLPSGRKLYYWRPRCGWQPWGGEEELRPVLSYWGKSATSVSVQNIHTYGGSLVENCIAAGALVLTKAGWKPIQTVTKSDDVWDGDRWVKHKGLIAKGWQTTIAVNGVRMTPEHRILTTKGWKHGKECQHDWVEVRIPDGYSASGSPAWETPMVGTGLCVWEKSRSSGQRFKEVGKARGHTVMRVYDKTDAAHVQGFSRDEQASSILGLAVNGRPMQTANTPIVEELWGAGDNRLPRVEGFQHLLGRHGANIQTRFNPGAQRQSRQLHRLKLLVGNPQNTSWQHKKNETYRNAVRRDAHVRSGRGVWRKTFNACIPVRCRRVASVESARLVYDLMDCGPQHRFTVMGADGPMLVHNCSQAIARDVILNGILNAQAQGIQIVLQVHDEIVCEAPTEHAEETMRVLEACMVAKAPWMAGLPLAVESWIGPRYKK
jgi:DNA polymerase bacteriophage-type